jgi:uncharacterized protein YgiM (DUF1202 family)
MQRLCTSILLLHLLAAGALAAPEVALFVRAGDVNLRDAPGAERTTVIGILQLGDEVRVRGQEGQWREVWCPRIRKTGWVAHWLLDEAPPSGVRREVAAVDCDSLCLREGPGQTYDSRATLAHGTVLDVIAYEGQWRKVRIPGSGQTGWVAAWLLRSAAPDGSASAPATSGGSGELRYVKGDRLYLRTGPGVENQAFAVLLQGTPIWMHEVADPWVRVEVAGGVNGWLHRDYIGLEGVQGSSGGVQILDAQQMRQAYDPELEAALQQLQPTQAYVTGDASNVRYGPGPQYPVRTTVNRGTVFTLVGASQGWFKGVFADGSEGWLAGWLCIAAQAPPEIAAVAVATPPTVPMPGVPAVAAEAERGRQVAQKALTMLGQPYSYGGASPGGFDCSGLVSWAHAQLGIDIPRSSYAQWDAGRPVSSEDLLPGDVVCFSHSSGPGVSHVGIYIGNGDFVHSPQTGEVVRVQSLASRSRSFCGARRFW